MAGLFYPEVAMARRRDFLVDKKIGSVIRMQRVDSGISQAELVMPLVLPSSKSKI